MKHNSVLSIFLSVLLYLFTLMPVFSTGILIAVLIHFKAGWGWWMIAIFVTIIQMAQNSEKDR
jgi:ABC-type dipeptide/oligopeptide/nickel transport system permease component